MVRKNGMMDKVQNYRQQSCVVFILFSDSSFKTIMLCRRMTRKAAS
jgi:hypothetical protein